MADERCETCVFWLPPQVEPEGNKNLHTYELWDSYGRCRRQSPISHKFRLGRMNWPISDAGDWCGEFERRV